MPSSKYLCHRVTICRKCAMDSEPMVEFGEKNVSESRDEIVFAKSAGVTSETNQGNSLGLLNLVRDHDRHKSENLRRRTETPLQRSTGYR